MKQYINDIFLFLAATLPSLASLVIDAQSANDYYWLQRSGSLMVLFAVILDFRQYSFAESEEAEGVFINGKAPIIGRVIPVPRQYIQKVSIALAVIGTFIWGYGDVPFKIA